MDSSQLLLDSPLVGIDGTWLDVRLLPAGVSALSLVLLPLLVCRRSSSIEEGNGPPTTIDEDRPLRARIAEHIDARGGSTIVVFNVVRFLGTLTLAMLTAVAVHLDLSSKGGLFRSGIIEIALGAAYIYASILSLLYLLVSHPARRSCNAVAVTILLTQFLVFAWRNLLPLTMFDGVPADLDVPWLLWSRGVLVTLVGIIIPLFVPREYMPVDPKHPMPVPAAEQTSSLFSFLFYFWVDPVVLRANREGGLSYDDLPPLIDEDYASTLADRGMDLLDPLRRQELGLRKQHLALGIIWYFRWEYVQMSIYLVMLVLFRFLAPVGINRLLKYLENDGADAVVRPWVWIACIFISPTISTLFFCLFVYTANHAIIQAESLLVQLLLRHAFRVRVTDDTPIVSTSSSSIGSMASASTSGVSTPVNEQSSNPSVTSTGDTANPSEHQNTTDGVKPLPVPNQTTLLGPSKEILKSKGDAKAAPKEPSIKSLHLFAKINNMFGTDIANIVKLIDAVTLVVDTPLQIILSISFLHLVLGWAALVGIGFMVLTIPLPGAIVSRIQRVQRLKMQKTDQRVQAITESLSLIRMIKMFAWEPLVKQQVTERRDDELRYLQTRKLLDLANDILLGLLPMTSMTIAYGFYTLVMGRELDASTVFSSLPIFDLLSDNLSFAIVKVSGTIRAKVALDRVTGFLYESLLLDRYKSTHSIPTSGTVVVPTETRIGFHQATFSWRDPQDDLILPSQRTFLLHLDNLLFEHGAINLIVGPTGCGKTSILMSLLGEMHFIPQSADAWFSLPREGGVAYAAQESWVQNDTIKENIIFGSPYEESRYRTVLYECVLEPDLALFTAGDNTEVGEKGLTLSGGQKARITLARAVYSSAQVLLLDDIVSALDVHTARWVVEKCLKGHLLKGRTVILVTHAIALAAPVAQKIISLDAKGRILSQGALETQLSKDATLREELLESRASLEQVGTTLPLEADPLKDKASGKLTLTEEMADGRFKWASMKLLLAAFGSFLSWFSALAGFVSAVAVDTFAMWWLGHWAQAYATYGSEVNVIYYLCVFIGLVVLQQLSYGTGSVIYTFGTTRASRKLHADLIDSVLSSTFRWLDSTPVGRIVSRFTQDIGEIDGALTEQGQTVIRMTIKLILKFGAAIAFSPAFLLPGLIITVLGIGLGHIYMIAQMAIKRIRSNWRSPLYNHLGASVLGLVSIRAYGAEDKFELVLRQRADAYSRPSRTFWNLNRWIAVRMNFLGAAFSGSLAAYLTYSRRGISASNTGFSLHMAVEFSGMILWWIRALNGLEVSANSLERVRDYLSIPHERAATPEERAPAYWPASGSIKASGLCARYSQDGPLVLKDLNFAIKSGERIGIVGRTGSGKSSLTLALLQLIPTTGDIYLDGRAAHATNLDDLRSSMTIIPQEPMLLSGTIRSNLDPYSQHDEATLYDALRVTGLLGSENSSANSDISLDTTVANAGSNFSVGQRQLIALARAILRHTQVVILDEATASIDAETDAIIQASIRMELQNATLITIAHRLLTIMDYDRIMVLSEGQLMEFDTPFALLQNAHGYFRSLVDESGEKEKLIAMAKKGRMS
ncbi:P-loop containing nucleoside triphosphate hydrolase protein [Calocera cornea HHB12733]|uniref:p-loop containing nucleoside triphosphate hydrolase protein n=1 Tax=Calocera cornea HHB12733 TaxID=1353952 RepID=A0A165IIR1_9BASI|nr:P-loop containing nucleoside triphosphate hydrolase protein [Calocera cornea HHB12733]